MDDHNDVFMTDESQNENDKKIFQNEYEIEINKIANRAFNEGYLSSCDIVDEEKYNEGYAKGKEYSFDFGKIFGLIEVFNFLQTIKFIDSNNIDYIKSKENDFKEINKIKEEMENYKDKLDKIKIANYYNKIKDIINKYYSIR